MGRRYWLMKSEPDVFGWEDLLEERDRTTYWDGVRNYQARNFLRDGMQEGDGVLFYHSNAEPRAVVGIARVVRAGYPAPTQFDPRAKYYDAKSSPDNPRWYAVDIQAERAFRRPVTLQEMRETPGLEDFRLIRRGNRLSVLPVAPAEWKIITGLGRRGRAPG